MAILNNIRKRGIFLIIIIAMALFAFILSDVLTKGGGAKGQEVAASINGEDISRVFALSMSSILDFIVMEEQVHQSGNHVLESESTWVSPLSMLEALR